ncbi:TSUP family transporter [Spongiactinospora sp. 9N601]|uniref:TSUP family transporter n=1 Tax=Spongiactinospora sp. 9N601 TaxID=3375149 RepID=UPI0037AC798D
MTTDQVVLVLVAAFAAGWVEAVAGGGGLIQVPILMIAGLPPAVALATNKVGSLAATAMATITYLRGLTLDLRIALPAAALALVLAGLGAATTSALSPGHIRPAIMVILVAMGLFVAFQPSFGTRRAGGPRTRRRTLTAILLAGVPIAFYDGLFGPGSGMFLVFAFTALLRTDLVAGSAMAKIVNTANNTGALLVFTFYGNVLWSLGAAMAVCNAAGSYLGARMALRQGVAFVRIALLCVVVGLVARLALQ